MITGMPVAVAREQVERVVGRLAGVDHERPRRARAPARSGRRTRAPDPRAASSRACSRARSRRSRAPSACAASSASSASPASSKPSDSCGWRPMQTKTSSCSSAAASAWRQESPVIPIASTRLDAAPRARARPARGTGCLAVRRDGSGCRPRDESRCERMGTAGAKPARAAARPPRSGRAPGERDAERGSAPADDRGGRDLLVEQDRAVGERDRRDRVSDQRGAPAPVSAISE